MRRVILGMAIAAWACAGPLFAQAPTAELVEGELQSLTELLPGTYDNFEQVQRQGEIQLPREGWNSRAHHEVRRIELPALGPHVFYLRSHLNDDPTAIYREIVSSFAVDMAAGAVRERQYRLNRPVRVYGVRPYASDLENLSAVDVEYVEGCDFLWRLQGGRFVATLDVAPCVTRGPGGLTFVRDYYVLEERALWRHEKWTDDNGRLVMGNALGIPQESRRARWFICEISLNQATDELSYTRRVELHDQGGSARVYTAAQRMAVGFLRMRRAWVTGRESQAELRLNWHASASATPSDFTLRHPDAGEIAVESEDVDAYCIEDENAPAVPDLKPHRWRNEQGVAETDSGG